MVTIIQQDGEAPFELHSQLRGPIRGLSLLRRSLLFAELALIAYNDYQEALAAATAIGLPDVQFFNHDGSQAYRFRNRHDCVIACRGTEPSEWNDIRADANAVTALAETVGRVHRGFKREVDDLWPMLEAALRANTLPVWFCGHSLGGAMATICAARCYKSPISSNPEEIYTFGSPRVGDRQYMNHARLTYYRWVNNNDVVARVPPRWLGYVHSGQELYLDFRGRLKRYNGWQRTKDRLRGFVRGLARRSFDHFADHSVREYQRHILAAVRREELSIASVPQPSVVIHLPSRRRAA